ncbi:MAG: EAL domain-containing protein [Rhodocyclaceae bacterium]|nr:EAL domain-containing protein [Rhodocyclaceae bacterium]
MRKASQLPPDAPAIRSLLEQAEGAIGQPVRWIAAGEAAQASAADALVAPIQLGDECLGTLCCDRGDPARTMERQLRLSLVAQEAATRFAMARLASVSEHLQETELACEDLGHQVAAQSHVFEGVHADLATRESLLRQILDTSSVAIFLVDLEGRITRANRCMADMFGVEPAALEGAEYVSLVHPSEREVGRRKMLELLASQIDSVDLERRYWRSSGGCFWGRLTGKRFFTSDGVHVGLLGVIDDIDDRKRAEEQVRESEARFRQLFINNGNVFLMIDPDSGRIEDANPAAAAFYGYDVDTLRTMDIGQINALPPAEIARERAQAAARHRNYFVFPHRLRSGELRTVEVHSTPVEAAGRRLLFSIVIDITEREEANAKLLQAASVFTASREGILIADAQRNIIDVNPAFERITGYARDEVMGENPRLLSSGMQSGEFYARMFATLDTTGSWQGELWNRRKDGSIFAERMQIDTVRGPGGEVTRYVAVFSDITEHKAHEAELDRIAHYDELTGVANRRLLGDRLDKAVASARRSGRSVAICYCDLDGFKPINDRFGHAGGDALLVEITKRLKGLMRGADTIARLGGDEFVLLVGEIEEASALVAVLERVLAATAAPFLIEGASVNVSASIGVTVFPEDSSDPDTLLRHADQAMYRAKESGKNRYHLFDPSYDRAVFARREQVRQFARALDSGELVLHYQPKIDLVDGEVIGAEALLRWQHPESGLLLPGAFLPQVEGSDLEIALGEWVIGAVLEQIEAWGRLGLSCPLSANVSARHLLSPGFTLHLGRLLDAHPTVDPRLLELEILETAALTDLDHAANVVAECLGLGVRFALDDFGTGYASLLYFQRLPIDVLKVDRGFVCAMLEDPSDLCIVDSVVRLAGAFNRPVVAEGVESAETGAALVELGCRYGQGFGIARPMAAEVFPAWYARWKAERPWQISADAGLGDDPALRVIERHLDGWVRQLAGHLDDPEGGTPPDLHEMETRFTRWYRGNGMARYGQHPSFRDLGLRHGDLHRHARAAAAHAGRGEALRSRAALAALADVRRSMQAHLDALRDAAPAHA